MVCHHHFMIFSSYFYVFKIMHIRHVLSILFPETGKGLRSIKIDLVNIKMAESPVNKKRLPPCSRQEKRRPPKSQFTYLQNHNSHTSCADCFAVL